MQTWDHKTLYYRTESTLMGQKGHLFEDGTQLSGKQSPLTRIKALGLEGWELVAMTAAPYQSYTPGSTKYDLEYVYWLKKPL